jgi:hypothetical protein
MATNTEDAVGFSLDSRSRAKPSKPRKAQRPRPMATGLCAALMVRNGRFLPANSRNDMSNWISLRSWTSVRTVGKGLARR